MNWTEKTKWRLKEMGWSQRVLAEKSSVAYNTLKSALHSGAEPGSLRGHKIAIALDLDPLWLYDNTQDLSTVKYLSSKDGNVSTANISNKEIVNNASDTASKYNKVIKSIEYLGPDDPGISKLHKMCMMLVQEHIDRENKATLAPPPPGLYKPNRDDIDRFPGRMNNNQDMQN